MNIINGLVIWFTGLSAAGKSTIAEQLRLELIHRNKQVCILDGDKVREGLCSDLGFCHEDRVENIRRVAEVAKLFCEAGIIVIVALISPYREDRLRARDRIGHSNFIEVFVDCPIEECERRDPKGLYSKVRKGIITKFTGISDSYEKPLNPEIHLKTDELKIEQCVQEILNYLSQSQLSNRSMVVEFAKSNLS